MTTSRRSGKRGRKPAKIDVKAKLERSRQSARECRARKKLRYQYLEELVSSRERAIFSLRRELEASKLWCKSLDSGTIPPGLLKVLKRESESGAYDTQGVPRTTKWCQILSDESSDEDGVDIEILGSEPSIAISRNPRPEQDQSETGPGTSTAGTVQTVPTSRTSIDPETSKGSRPIGRRTLSILRLLSSSKNLDTTAEVTGDQSVLMTSSPYAMDTPASDTITSDHDISDITPRASRNSASVLDTCTSKSVASSHPQFTTIDSTGLLLNAQESSAAIPGTSYQIGATNSELGLGTSVVDFLSDSQLESLLQTIEKGDLS